MHMTRSSISSQAERHPILLRASNHCNRAKGTDLRTILPNSRELIRFFNPRVDRWLEHFILLGVLIQPRTAIGEATFKILRLNDSARILERQTLHIVERYPPNEASHIFDEKSPS
jgi:hypothetical protein